MLISIWGTWMWARIGPDASRLSWMTAMGIRHEIKVDLRHKEANGGGGGSRTRVTLKR